VVELAGSLVMSAMRPNTEVNLEHLRIRHGRCGLMIRPFPTARSASVQLALAYLLLQSLLAFTAARLRREIFEQTNRQAAVCPLLVAPGLYMARPGACSI